MKKLICLLILPVLLALSGCDDGCPQKVNPKKLEGFWEVYDGSTADYLGRSFMFLKEQRMIIKDEINETMSINIYEFNGRELSVYKTKPGQKKSELKRAELREVYNIKFENNTLYVAEKNDPDFWMKFRKLDELP